MRKAKDALALESLPDTAIHGGRRSTLFWLLHSHHAALSARWSKSRVNWQVVATWAAEHGGLDRTGMVPSPATTKKTWQRVCAQVAQEKLARAMRARPAVVPTPRQAAPPIARPVHSQPQEALVPQGSDSAENRIAALNAKLARRSGRA